MLPPRFSPLLAVLKLKLKSDFESATEHLRPFETPSRDFLAYKVFNLLRETQIACGQQQISPKTLHGRIESGLIQKGWTTGNDGLLLPSTRNSLQLLTTVATTERDFRLQLNFMRRDMPDTTDYILSRLKDISHTRSDVSIALAREYSSPRTPGSAFPQP